MTYTYRRTKEDHPKNDTHVHHDGVHIGRIYQFDSGAQDGLWGWFGAWSGPGNSGRVDSFEEALDAIKFIHQKIFEGDGVHRWPDGTVSRLVK